MNKAEKSLALQLIKLAKDGDETYKEMGEELVNKLGLTMLALDLLIILAKNPDAGRYGESVR